MQDEHIEEQYNDSKKLYNYLMKNNEVEYLNYFTDSSRKTLLLSVASYFEKKIIEIILDFVSSVSKSESRLKSMVQRRILDRQYHTLFDWNASNTNSFWSNFGADAKDHARQRLASNDELLAAEKDFIDLGKERNKLVHQNFVIYNMNLTLDEIYTKYVSSCKFLEFIQNTLMSND